MTAPFDPREFRRLSEAATPGPWSIGADGMDGNPPLVGVRDLCYATINEDVTWPNRADLDLVAYLGTHREAILRMLEAADALAEAAAHVRLNYEGNLAVVFGGSRLFDKLAAYKKARGE